MITRYAQARKVLDKYVIHVLGVSLEDLPDNPDICNIVDEIESRLDNGESPEDIVKGLPGAEELMKMSW